MTQVTRALDIRPLTPKLGARMRGVRLADGMDLPPAAQVAFARRLSLEVPRQFRPSPLPAT